MVAGQGTFTLARLILVQLHLQWLGYNENEGRVKAEKQDNIIINIFDFSWHCFAIQV